MFQLLNPTWLFAIAALGVPVIIHLWNIRPGKTLKVGSIAFIEASSRKSSRSFSLMDLLLLLLRCLFLLLLAILIAQPYWTTFIKPGKLKGWVLIPRQNIHQVYSKFKPWIDSLTKAGYGLHYFNTGFAVADTAQFKATDSARSAPIKNWVLLKQLSQQVPATLPLYLFTTNSMESIGGARPQLALNMHVQTYIPADSASKWIQGAAFVSSSDGIKIMEGNSKPSGTIFSNTTVQGTEQRNSPYQVNITNGQPAVSFKGDTVIKAIAVDTTTLRIAIYGDKNTPDASYLKAALEAVKQFTDRKISIQVSNNTAVLPGKPDRVFWLREQRLPSAIAENISNIFIYELGKVQNIHSWISISGKDKIALSKHIIAENSVNEIVWPDGFGNPVLSLENNGNTRIYHFYSRFDPAWNDLVWNEAFPQMMLKLLIAADKDKGYDKRIVDDKQLQPRLSDDKTTLSPNKLSTKTDLSKAFWLALVLLFLMERRLAHRTKSTENYD